MMKNNVVELNERQRETREQVLERLFKVHGSALRAFLCNRVKSEAEADDLLQEVFVRLARLDDLSSRLARERSDSRSFIFTTANNLIVDQERRKAVRRHHQDAEREQAGETHLEVSPEAILVARQELSVVKQAILNLPPAWARAFTLSRFRHMSYKDIAQDMGLSVKVIEKYITRALIELRNATRSDQIERAKGTEGGQQ